MAGVTEPPAGRLASGGVAADLGRVWSAVSWAVQTVEEWAPAPARTAEGVQRARVVSRLRTAAAVLRAMSADPGPPPPATLPTDGGPRVEAFDDAGRVLTIRCHGRDLDEAKRLCTRMVLVDQLGARGFAATAAVQHELRRLGWRQVPTGVDRSGGQEWKCGQHAAQSGVTNTWV